MTSLPESVFSWLTYLRHDSHHQKSCLCPLSRYSLCVFNIRKAKIGLLYTRHWSPEWKSRSNVSEKECFMVNDELGDGLYLTWDTGTLFCWSKAMAKLSLVEQYALTLFRLIFWNMGELSARDFASNLMTVIRLWSSSPEDLCIGALKIYPFRY